MPTPEAADCAPEGPTDVDLVADVECAPDGPSDGDLAAGLEGPAGQAAPPIAAWRATAPVVIGAPTPVFESRPIRPSFRSTPYRPDTSIDGWGSERYVVRAASTRGAGHRFSGAPRQDEAALLHTSSGRLIAAVADGVSAAPQSHLGATIAVRQSVQLLAQSVQEASGEIDWRDLAKQVAWQLVAQAQSIADGVASDESPEAAERLFATTLVCALIEPLASGQARIQGMSIGDSGAWLVRDGHYELLAGAKQAGDSPIASSAVVALPRIPAEIARVDAILEPGDLLMMATDGIGDPLGDGSGTVGRTLWEALREPPSLIDFCRIVDFSRETFDDDRTLVAVWIK